MKKKIIIQRKQFLKMFEKKPKICRMKNFLYLPEKTNF